ncbi:hypothetical protein BN1708_020289, partial [Verticillium longisporum]
PDTRARTRLWRHLLAWSRRTYQDGSRGRGGC